VKLLTRYVTREVAVPAVLALAVFSFIGVAGELRERLDFINLSYAEVGDFARLAAWFIPTLIPYIVPLMYMMGVMLAFGGLTRNNEVTAMKAAGIPLKRVVLPVILGGALLSAGAFYLQDRVQPTALRKANALIFVEAPKRISLDVLTTGVMHEFGDWRVYIGSRDRASGTLYDVDILVPREDGSIWLYHADSATFGKRDGRAQLHIPSGYLIMPGASSLGPISDFTLTAPSPEAMPMPGGRRLLSLSELLARDRAVQAELKAQAGLTDLSILYDMSLYRDLTRLPEGISLRSLDEFRKLRLEILERISLPLACLALSFVAAPLAVRGGRSGRSWSFAIGFGVCLAYFVIWMVTQPLIPRSLTETMVRGSIANAVMLVTGAVALWRVDRV
jgi:lipopolysaccharide export system permease protein